MEIQTKKETNGTVVTISGRLDAVTAPEYEKAVTALITDGEIKLIEDMEGP